MMPRGRLSASSALHSGTTRGTSLSMRKALELSIITAPYLVMSSQNSFEVPAPADVKAMSTSLKSSLCWSSFTSYSLPRKVYLVPAERCEPNNTSSSSGKFLSSSTRRNSCPTAPDAPTIATFIFVSIFFLRLNSFIFACKSTKKCVNISIFQFFFAPLQWKCQDYSPYQVQR